MFKRIFILILSAGLLLLNQCTKDMPTITGGGSDTENAWTAHGIVYGTDGNPVPGTVVRLYTKDYNPVSNENKVLSMDTTGPDGDYCFPKDTIIDKYVLIGEKQESKEAFATIPVAVSSVARKDSLLAIDSAYLVVDGTGVFPDSNYLWVPSAAEKIPLDTNVLTPFNALPNRTYRLVFKCINNDSVINTSNLVSKEMLRENIIMFVYFHTGIVIAPYHYIDSASLSKYNSTTWNPLPPFDARGIAYSTFTHRFYISDNRSYQVMMFDDTGNYLGCLADVFQNPSGITIDGTGRIFVCDSYNDSVKVFSTDNQKLFSFGGRGTGDGLFLNHVGGVAVDAGGNSYTVEMRVTNGYSYIQKFDPNGHFLLKWKVEFRKTPGNYDISYIGIGVDKSMGYVYVTDPTQDFLPNGKMMNGLLLKYDASGNFLDSIQLTSPFPTGVVVDDSGRIYVASALQVSIYSRHMQLISVEKGPIVPMGIALGRRGQIFVNDQNQERVFILYPIASGFNAMVSRPAFAKTPQYPSQYRTDSIAAFPCTGIAFNTVDGMLYASREDTALLVRFHTDGTPDTAWPIDAYCKGIAIDNNSLYLCQTDTVKKNDCNGNLLLSFGRIGAGNGQFSNRVENIAIDSLGNIYTTERFESTTDTACIQKFDRNGVFLNRWGTEGAKDGQFSTVSYHHPKGIAVDKKRGIVYVTDPGNLRVQAFDTAGTFLYVLSYFRIDPYAVCIDNEGLIYVASHDAQIYVFSPDKSLLSIEPGLSWPSGITVDQNKNIFVCQEDGSGNGLAKVCKLTKK